LSTQLAEALNLRSPEVNLIVRNRHLGQFVFSTRYGVRISVPFFFKYCLLGYSLLFI
jgi:hypothetical protein